MADTGCVNCGRECGGHPADNCKQYVEPSRYGRKREQPGAIKLEQQQYERALAGSYATRNVEEVAITGGEPFLRKDLPELCEILLKHCPAAFLSITTNAMAPKLCVERIQDIRRRMPDRAWTLEGEHYAGEIQRDADVSLALLRARRVPGQSG